MTLARWIAATPTAALAIAALACSGAAPRETASDETARIRFESTRQDLGELDEGEERTVEFRFESVGRSPLRIFGAHAFCGSWIARIEVNGSPYRFGDPIAPGATGIVRIPIHTAGFEGVKCCGGVVETNDPAYPRVSPLAVDPRPTLDIACRVRKRFAFEGEPALVFGLIPSWEATERSFVVKSSNGRPMQVLGFEPLDREINLRAEPTDASASR